MKSKIKFLLFLAPITLAGCAANPERMALAQNVQNTVPSCKEAEDCKLKWAAARTWVLNNAYYKIQTYSDDYLTTFNSTDSSTHLMASVNKEPQPDGSFKIVASVGCANWIGCDKDPLLALLDFNQKVGSVGMQPIAKTAPTSQ